MSSPIRRHRRTKAEIEGLKAALYDIVEAERPMTVRQVFYQMTSRGLIEKTESEYKTTVCRLLSQMRLDGDLPFDWIADSTRWMRKPDTHDNLRAMLDITTSAYRRAIWQDQEDYVEIWLEKDALSGVLYTVTSEWDVPLMVTRGYPSLSFLHGAAQAISWEDKPTYIYYVGDWDPSGLDIERNTEQRLLEFSDDADITFERIAVTPEQVRAWNLSTRPTKKTDRRAKNFEGESIEVDAISPSRLRALVDQNIKQHVDEERLKITHIAEQSEREILNRWDEALQNIQSQ